MAKEYVKKITVATLGVDSRELETLVDGKGNAKIPVVRVYGRAVDSKEGMTDLGPFTAFSGSFEAVNLFNGKKVRSGKLILPGVAEGLVADALAGAKAKDPSAALEFGLDITVSENPSKKGGKRYTYGVVALTEGAKDVLDEIGATLGNLPLLAAPAKSKK